MLVNCLEFKINDFCVLELKGKLDALSSPPLREKIMATIDRGEHKIILDCSGLDYVSSAGLRVLFEAAFKLQEFSESLVCCSVTSNVKKIFDLVDLPSEITVLASREEALR